MSRLGSVSLLIVGLGAGAVAGFWYAGRQQAVSAPPPLNTPVAAAERKILY